MPGNWQYVCCVMWEYLHEESVDWPGSAADKWFKSLQEEYGEETSSFPHIGCGCNFIPFAKGPSMVCEIRMNQNCGEWEAFLADQTPPALDDQLKYITYKKLTDAFGMVPPAEMIKAIPMTMPMTHIHTHEGKRMEGIAKYPLDSWETAGDPCFTTEKWGYVVYDALGEWA